MAREDLPGYFVREIEKLLISYGYSDYLKKIISEDLDKMAKGQLSTCVRLCIEFSDYRASFNRASFMAQAQPKITIVQPQLVQIPPPAIPVQPYIPPHLSMWHSNEHQLRKNERLNQENQPYSGLK